MQSNVIPPTINEFLAAHGGTRLAGDGFTDPAALVSLFREARPASGSDPLSPENRVWLSAVADCIGVMDERLYEHYRAMIDLFRNGVFRTDREKLLSSSSWDAVREKGIHLGILPAELYGQERPCPHVGMSDVYCGMTGENRA